MARIPFAKNSATSDSPPASAEDLVNLYAEEMPPNGRSEVLVRHVPGLVDWSSAGLGPVIAGHVFGLDAYFVIGGFTATNQVWKFDPNGAPTLIGTVANNVPVTIAASATQMVICCPPLAYVINLAGTLTQITDPDFPDVTSVTYVAGFFVFSVRDSDQYIISDLLNALAYDALDIATAESVPDKMLRVVESHNELWLFGTRSIEMHNLVGGADFPFQRQSGGIMDRGTIAFGSVAECDSTLMWLGNDLVVYRANGYQEQRISTHAIEKEIATYAQPNLARAHRLNYVGHDCYVLTFPTTVSIGVGPGRTFVYDAVTKLWHRRASVWAGVTREWLAGVTLRFNGMVLVGRGLSGGADPGRIYRLDGTVPTEGGQAIVAIATLPPLFAETGLATMDRLDLEAEVGGNATELSVALSYSDDGGYVYGPPKVRSMGSPGDRTARVRWLRQGKFRQRVIRLTFAAGSKLGMYGVDVVARGTRG